MEQVPMNDGLDGRETIAFGLGTGEVAAFVVALMAAYAAVHSGVVGPVAWLLAVCIAGGGALLAWGRLDGRPMLEWAVLLAGFTVRTAPARASRWRCRLATRWAVVTARARELRVPLVAQTTAVGAAQAGAVVIPLALRRPHPTVPLSAPAQVGATGRCAGSQVVGFFSLAGGTGRSTLAVEVAAILALRARAAAAAGGPTRRVVLLDLARRNPVVAARLGMAPPPGDTWQLLTHSTGLTVGVAPASALPASAAPWFPAALDEANAANLVIVDFDCDLGDDCRALLGRCDQLLVTVTPTAGGVLDAYRSTALLRRLGHRQRLHHLVNHWRPGVDLREVMTDLGADVIAEIPDDPALMDAELTHQPAGVRGDGPLSEALERLASRIDRDAGGARAVPDAPRWGRHAG